MSLVTRTRALSRNGTEITSREYGQQLAAVLHARAARLQSVADSVGEVTDAAARTPRLTLHVNSRVAERRSIAR